MSKDSIKARGELERIETQLNELAKFVDDNPDLPPSVLHAISIKQDILLSDVSSLRLRIKDGETQ